MYGKIFTSIWDGSLYGQLEATATLMALVTLCNADGVIDMTPEAISGRTGWPIEFVRKGIEQLEQPDSRSRTGDHDGRRLVRLDEHRTWGWLIVNYTKYREKKDLDTARDQNRERVRRFREREKQVTDSNDPSRNVTLCNGSSRQAEAEAEAEKKKPRRAQARDDSPDAKTRGEADPPPGLDPVAWSRWEGYRREIRKPLKPVSIPAAQRELAAFGSDQAAVVEQSVAQGWQGLFALKPKPKPAATIGGRQWE